MTGHVLTLNSGSSSLKVALYRLGAPGTEPEPVLSGQVDRIAGAAHLSLRDREDAWRIDENLCERGADHAAALDAMLAQILARAPEARIAAIGHRVVHGGPDHAAPADLTPALIAELDDYCALAPLHQPHNLAGIRGAMRAFPRARQVACFDTAFHRTQPFEAEAFALPRELYRRGVRRYGFHGLSYDYIAGVLAETEPALARGKVVVAHLGNGASMCAIRDGRSIASTMGFSPLDGLPMGTRCGQVDPGVLLWLMEHEGLDAAAITDLLSRRSGLLGLSGISNDMRTLEASGEPAAAEAIACFAYRIRRALGDLAAALGGLDGLVFTGGIGENSARVRAEACAGTEWMGIALDAGRNAAGTRELSSDRSRVRVLRIPTDEERVIARAAAARLAAA